LSRPRDYQLVRNKNRYLVLQTLWNRAPITREEIASLTGLSNPTVQAALQDFKGRGLLTDANRRESTGGRPAAELALNPEAVYALAAWLSVPTMRAAVLDLRGSVVATQCCSSTDTPFVLRSTEMLHHGEEGGNPVRRSANRIAASESLMHCVGFRSDQRQRMASRSDWCIPDRGVRPPGILMADTQSALAAELVLGMQQSPGRVPPQSALFIVIREGLGDGLILNGRLHDGSHGNGGFMGHMCLDVTGPVCTCGARGCLETYVSELAIIRDVARRLATGEMSTTLRADNISIDQISVVYKQGDPLVMQVMEAAADWLALGIANAIKLVQPELVILSTSTLYTDKRTLARLTAGCSVPPGCTDPVLIVPASVDCDAELKGVGMITLERAVASALALAPNNGLMEVVELPVLT
jgi:predicted NBD/HSP70 family sugar kinase